MPTKTSEGLGVTAGDVLALRGAGLAAGETWALLCQAAQALQDLFLSNGGVVGGSRAGPVVTPHTLELTPRGRVTLLVAPPETARAYLPPEYRPGRVYSDTDSEKMWMYSLGRALLDTTPRVTALTGTVSVSPSSALQSVLAAMTEPDPHRRASLMNLLDVISEYCQTRLQSRPFTHVVMDMYREVVRSPQYAARKRAFLVSARLVAHPGPIYQQGPSANLPKYHPKNSQFKIQSLHSRSQPNLLSLSGSECKLSEPKSRFQSQMNVQDGHVRNSSQPECHDQGIAQSSHELFLASQNVTDKEDGLRENPYGDPIYALPVKPFLSSQDVRVNGISVAPLQSNVIYAQPMKNRGYNKRGLPQSKQVSSNQINSKEEIYAASARPPLHRQHSNPQLPSRNQELRFTIYSNPRLISNQLRVFTGGTNQQQFVQQQNLVSSMNVSHPSSPDLPKPPRIITTLKRTAAPLSDSEIEISETSEPLAKNTVKNGPRARRGKAVQRAPSRLYRAFNGPARSFNKTQCVGPEFVVRASQPPKMLKVGEVKTGSVGRIVVILLNGQRLEVTCDPQKITAGQLFQAIVQTEGLDENFTLGLAALLAGDFAMLPPDMKLNKVAPPGWLNGGKSKGPLGLPTSFMLYLRLRFFLPSLRGMRSWISKHLLYLQIRRCILEQQLICSLSQLINLTGLALQAEFGNYSVNEHGCGDYFLLEHYVPESLILNTERYWSQSQLPSSVNALKMHLQQAHRERHGLDANKAEEMFIAHAQSVPDYGSHYYIATVDTKDFGKIVARLRKNDKTGQSVKSDSENICVEKVYDFYNKMDAEEATYIDEQKMMVSRHENAVYAIPKNTLKVCTVGGINNGSGNNGSNNSNVGANNKTCGKTTSKSHKNESNVWLAIHVQGLKVLGRGDRPRERAEIANFQWRDIQTLSYSKSCLVVYTRINGKRCKFKLRMDQRKSYFAFKLTSLHHQFFLRLRSELTSLQGLAKDFGVPLIIEPHSSPPKIKSDSGKSKISIANALKKHQRSPKCLMQLEEYQNKENENPQKEHNIPQKIDEQDCELLRRTPEEDALYAQVNARLEPEGASRDTEDESERAIRRNQSTAVNPVISKPRDDDEKIYSYANLGIPCDKSLGYSVPKPISANNVNHLNNDAEKNPEVLYAAINKKAKFPIPEEIWDVSEAKKNANLQKVKTSSLPNYGTPKQNRGYRTPSLPRRLGVKMGTRAIYSSLLQRDPALADDLESMSLKSDTASSIRSTSARSTESPMPEAYVLNADIRTNNETFRITDDETMSSSLAARLEELSFAEERILQTIKLERGHGGSIGLQVTEGNDGGVYVQAVSVGGSADMAGNVNKGDRIVAINGQSLLNLRYEDALKLLQSSSETVELVLSQIAGKRNMNVPESREQEPLENNYLNNIRFDVSSETSSVTTKWPMQKALDVASVQNTSSAYSSAASSAMGNHNANSSYLVDVADTNALNSASMLLSLEDFDVSRTSRQVFI